MATGTRQFQNIVKKLEKTVAESIKKAALVDVGVFARDLIVKRTRLGYGVEKDLGSKKRLAKLSPNYIKRRKMFESLSENTRPSRSNLTLTGQMLDSIISTAKTGIIEIKPTGRRDDGKRNADIAQYNEDGGRGSPKRIFMRISQLEFKQIVRFYRKTFGDLLRKSKVI
jgi:hypothetical protein